MDEQCTHTCTYWATDLAVVVFLKLGFPVVQMLIFVLQTTCDFFITYIHTHTRLTAPFSGTTRVSRYQKGKTNLDFPEARDSEWQWHRLGHMQVCTSLHTDNHASTPTLSFLQAGCPSCGPTNSIKALKAYILVIYVSMCITDEHEVNRNFVLMVFH